jgi:hypothetical protein
MMNKDDICVLKNTVFYRPSVGGLCFPEYVIYRGEQVRTLDVTAIPYLNSVLLSMN